MPTADPAMNLQVGDTVPINENLLLLSGYGQGDQSAGHERAVGRYMQHLYGGYAAIWTVTG